jgi:hypothetical protein
METQVTLLESHFKKTNTNCDDISTVVANTHFVTSQKKGLIAVDYKEYGALTKKFFVCLILQGEVKGIIPVSEFKKYATALRSTQAVFSIHSDLFATPKTLRLPEILPLSLEKKWMCVDPSSVALETSETLGDKLETLTAAISLMQWSVVRYPKIRKAKEKYIPDPTETSFFEQFYKACGLEKRCTCPYCNVINISFFKTFLPATSNRAGVAQRILGDYIKTVAVCMFMCLKKLPEHTNYALDLVKSHPKYTNVVDFDKESRTNEWNGDKVFRGPLEYVCRMDVSKYMKYVPKRLGDSIYKGWLYLTLFDLYFFVIPAIQKEELTKLTAGLDTINPEETEESRSLGMKILPYTSRVSKKALTTSQILDIEDLCTLAPPCLSRVLNDPKEFNAKHIDRKNLASFFVHFKIPPDQIKDFVKKNWGKTTKHKQRIEEFYSWVATYNQRQGIEPISCKTVVLENGCPFKTDTSGLQEGQQVEELCRMKCSRTLAVNQERVFYSPVWYAKYQLVAKKPKME